jgi:hypothetical protein
VLFLATNAASPAISGKSVADYFFDGHQDYYALETLKTAFVHITRRRAIISSIMSTKIFSKSSD